MNVPVDDLPPLGDRKKLRKSRHAHQVKLDVDRSVKRFPERMPEKQRLVLQEVGQSLSMFSTTVDSCLAIDGFNPMGAGRRERPTLLPRVSRHLRHRPTSLRRQTGAGGGARVESETSSRLHVSDYGPNAHAFRLHTSNY